jgi:gamma-glutamylcyclotransferase (GGCT)/AIG2-like uncharacterized protein YtfP
MTERNLPLFVYGYLRTGGPGHHLVAPSLQTVKNATAKGRRSDTKADYPGIVFSPEGEEVIGQLLYLKAHEFDEVMRKLDEYEGAPERYTRITTMVSCEGDEVECYVYQWNER